MLFAIKIFIAAHFLLSSSSNSLHGAASAAIYTPKLSAPGAIDRSKRVAAFGNEQFMYKDESTEALEKLVAPWLLYYTNQYRADAGVDTLKYDNCLQQAAKYHADYLFNESKEKHQFKLVHVEDPESKWFKGKGPSDRALTAGCKKYCGENALYFTRSGWLANEAANKAELNEVAKKMARDMVYDQWHKSKPHRENMLTKGYLSLGVSATIGKRSENNAPEQLVVFGVQVMAY